MLLAALPGNTLLFREKRFVLMLMNPLSIQQSCLHDTNGSGIQHSSCLKSSPCLSFRQMPFHYGQKAHSEFLLYAQQFHKVECYVFSMYSSPVDEMDIALSCVHQQGPSSYHRQSKGHVYLLLLPKRDLFLPTHNSTQYYPVKLAFVTINRETFKVSRFDHSHEILKPGIILLDL